MPIMGFLQKNRLKGARKESCSCYQDYLITWFNKQFKTLIWKQPFGSSSKLVLIKKSLRTKVISS